MSKNSQNIETHIKYNPEIDSLRAIAVLAVIVFHYFPNFLKGGFVGVDIFFVISGFLISYDIFNKISTDNFSLKEFYQRRIKRIFPSLIIIYAFCYSIGWFYLFPYDFSSLGKHIHRSSLFYLNFTLINKSGYFNTLAETKPLLHLWSLSIEEQFYICFPLFFLLLKKIKGRQSYLLFFLFAASFAFSLYCTFYNPTLKYYSPFSRSWELLIGSSAAYIKHKKINLNFIQKIPNFLSLFIIFFSFIIIDKEKNYPGFWAFLPTLGTVAIILKNSLDHDQFKFLRNKVFIFIGLISYPLYLWHWVLLSFSRIFLGQEPTITTKFICLFASFLFAYISYRFVEKPIRFNQKFKMAPIFLLILILILSGLGKHIYKNDGYIFRDRGQINSNVASQFAEGPHWEYEQNKNCTSRFKTSDSNTYTWWFCISNTTTSPEILIVGNSYANQYYPGFLKNDFFNKYSLLSIGACAPAWTDKVFYKISDPTSPCYGYRPFEQQELVQSILNTNQVKYVILAGLAYSSLNNTNYLFNLKKRILKFLDSKVKVIVLYPHIKSDYEIKICFLKMFGYSGKDCKENLDQYNKINASMKLLENALSDYQNEVSFFNPNDTFCNKNGCSYIIDGLPVYRDQAYHLSEYASSAVVRNLELWVKNGFLKKE